MRQEYREVEILLVEDNPGDVLLTQEALKDGKVSNNLYWVKDGVDAINFLTRKAPFTDVVQPDVIFLDLNLPRKGGHEVLAFIKSDPLLKRIPVIILTSSKAESDVLLSYDTYANCYITKPVDLDKFLSVIRSLDSFWLSIVTLPPKENEN